jgi:hypothetical protein
MHHRAPLFFHNRVSHLRIWSPLLLSVCALTLGAAPVGNSLPMITSRAAQTSVLASDTPCMPPSCTMGSLRRTDITLQSAETTTSGHGYNTMMISSLRPSNTGCITTARCIFCSTLAIETQSRICRPQLACMQGTTAHSLAVLQTSNGECTMDWCLCFKRRKFALILEPSINC